MCLCYTRGERKGERRGGREQLFRRSVDLLPKIAKGVALQAVWGTESVGREGGVSVLSLHKVCETQRREGRKGRTIIARLRRKYKYNKSRMIQKSVV